MTITRRNVVDFTAAVVRRIEAIIARYLSANGFVAGGGAGGTLTDGDKGDITVSGAGANWQIDAGAVGVAELSSGAIAGQTTVTAVGADYVLISDTSDAGALKKALASDLAGPGGSGNNGTTTVNFGAFPGATDTSVAVTGQASIIAGSIPRATLRLEATADHSADEHWIEEMDVYAGNIVAATGFTIYARTRNRRLYGSFTVAWNWT